MNFSRKVSALKGIVNAGGYDEFFPTLVSDLDRAREHRNRFAHRPSGSTGAGDVIFSNPIDDRTETFARGQIEQQIQLSSTVHTALVELDHHMLRVDRIGQPGDRANRLPAAGGDRPSFGRNPRWRCRLVW